MAAPGWVEEGNPTFGRVVGLRLCETQPTILLNTKRIEFKETLNYSNLFLPILVGIISTFIFSYLSIAWLLRYLQRQSTWVFVWYRLAFGIVILGAIFSRN
ncbi:MAG: hypothetical protein KME60_07825 [Cyanomargarita calcarea GSE-NOS-MK-12-04C]|uniref:Undecaprenyl-diphosphatase n=1 Tax=Cyanomargarita calcarea GSE-NOS-MK-12-04C TaxID=2839659 RepID=A0A951US31_9CYAN|nr:hypothetical protein [Cyanomargarita calcarea GSE-NOS-MK-12-04C]